MPGGRRTNKAETKYCWMCEETKPTASFSPRRTGIDWPVQDVCRPCATQRRRMYRGYNSSERPGYNEQRRELKLERNVETS